MSERLDYYRCLPPFIGMRMKDAAVIANARGFTVRVISYNGTNIERIDQVLLYNRVNFTLNKDIVVAYRFY